MISVFKSSDRNFVRYLGGDVAPEKGSAQIARLIASPISSSIGGGVAIYERVTVDWDLPFDEMITVIEGAMHLRSGAASYDLGPGDVAWFPARTPLTYEVPDRVVVSYAKSSLALSGNGAFWHPLSPTNQNWTKDSVQTRRPFILYVVNILEKFSWYLQLSSH